MKYIIFDLDGTLSRTDKFMIPSIELAMEKMNIPVWTEDAIRCTIGEPVEVTNLKFFGQKKSEEADNFWKLVSGYYRTVFHNSVEEYEGVGDMLDSLHERGYKTAVCSNADEEYIEEVSALLRKYVLSNVMSPTDDISILLSVRCAVYLVFLHLSS